MLCCLESVANWAPIAGLLVVQMEIDYKAECHSGDAIESLGSSIKEDTNGTGIRRYANFSADRSCHCKACHLVNSVSY